MDPPESASINPYAPPAAVEGYQQQAPGAPPYQLYSVAAITLAGFLGATLAACVLIALNYLRLGRTGGAQMILAVGSVVTIALVASAFVLPENTPSWPFYVGHTLLAYFLADTTQRRHLAEHQRQGGKLASVWWAAGISILVSVLLLIAYLTLASLLLPVE